MTHTDIDNIGTLLSDALHASASQSSRGRRQKKSQIRCGIRFASGLNDAFSPGVFGYFRNLSIFSRFAIDNNRETVRMLTYPERNQPSGVRQMATLIVTDFGFCVMFGGKCIVQLQDIAMGMRLVDALRK